MKHRRCSLRLPASVDPRSIWEEAAGSHTCEPMDDTVQVQTFFDTFDWRLFNRNLVLLHDQDRYLLYRLCDSETVASLNLPCGTDPVYSTDLPEGHLKEVLQAHLSVRALLPLARARIRRQTVRVLNRNEKTVVIAELERARVAGATRNGQPFNTVSLRPVRGYEKHSRRLVRSLRDAGAEPRTEDLFHAAMRATGRNPGDYTSKLNIALEPDLNGAEAARRILGHLFRTIRRNETGIKKDLDTEFLHDFRVGIRRTRSALSQIKSVFFRKFRSVASGKTFPISENSPIACAIWTSPCSSRTRTGPSCPDICGLDWIRYSSTFGRSVRANTGVWPRPWTAKGIEVSQRTGRRF